MGNALVAPARLPVAAINTLMDLAASIRAVVDYNWDDERAHYDADENDSREVHIFNHLVALDNWINSTGYTPEEYLAVKLADKEMAPVSTDERFARAIPANERARRIQDGRAGEEGTLVEDADALAACFSDPKGEQIGSSAFGSVSSLAHLLLRFDAEQAKAMTVHGLDRMEIWQDGDKVSIRFTSAAMRSAVAAPVVERG